MNEPLSDFRPQSTAGAAREASAKPGADSVNPYESPDLVELPEDVEPEPPEISPLESQISVLLQQGKNGANWFYWIAGFSVANGLIMLFGGDIALVFGLSTTFIGGALAEGAAQNSPENAALARGIGFAFTLFIALVFCGIGWLANKRIQPVFFLGMLLYLLDGLLFLPLQMWILAGSHAYALFIMWSGFQAFRQLRALERKLMDPLHPAGLLNPHQPTEAA